jgi:hypothetical protein
LRIAASVATVDSRAKARRPVTISQSTEPKLKNVGAGVHAPALGLPRRHVGGRSDDHAVLGEGLEFGRFFLGHVRLDQLGEAEVEHLRGAARGDHDVGRLQVAVDDALGVRLRQRVGDLRRVPQRFR